MKILVVNAGSSSMKFQFIDTKNQKVLAKGLLERIGEKFSGNPVTTTFKANGNTIKGSKPIPTFADGVKIIMNMLTDKKTGVVKSINEIEAVGHRIVQGAEVFKKPTLIDNKVVKQIEDLTPLAPLHQPGHVAGIRGFMEVLPKVPMVAVFDTTFLSTIPSYASRYAIPEIAYKKWKIKRYGAHGTSHKYVSEKLAELMGKKGKFIVCHIGSGASISAVKNGKCIDSSMGFTPLDGLVMGTRTGDIEATVVTRVMEMTGKTAHEVITWMNKECGLKGVSGISNDIRDVEEAMQKGNKNAKLAFDMLCYRLKKYIGAYSAALGGVDAIAFTAGIGENDDLVRAAATSGLSYMGVEIDEEKNKNFKRGEINDITGKKSKAKVFVIPTDEEAMIARETEEIVSKITK